MTSFLHYILVLFVGSLLAVELGFRISRRFATSKKPNAAVLNGALYALLGLLLAFSFNGASSRFEERRSLAIDESIAMKIAYGNLAWLSAESQPEVKEKFREYVASRIVIYKLIPDVEAAMQAFRQSRVIKKELAAVVTSAIKDSDDRMLRGLVGGPISAMLGVEELRYAALQMHPPNIIFFLLIAITFIVAFLSTIETEEGAPRPTMSAILFALVISAVVYVILDIEFPRDGFIIADRQDYLLEEALQGMD